MKTVSIIIPIYNVEQYLDDCLTCVLKQTYKDIEIILVDDGSLDGSLTICQKYAEKYSNIKVLHKENGGLSDARNAGFSVATGEYIFFYDPDDIIDFGSIELLVSVLEKNDADISICSMRRTSRRTIDSGTNDINRLEIVNMRPKEALIAMLYSTPFSTSACGKLFKKDLFLGIEFPYRKFSEDLFTIYKVILKSKKISFCDYWGYLYYYRHEGSIVVSRYTKKHLDAIDALVEMQEDIDLKDLEIKRAHSSQMISVICDIVARYPTKKDLKHDGIWDKCRENRRYVLTDRKAPRRLRVFSALTYLGKTMTIACTNAYYYLKWKR